MYLKMWLFAMGLSSSLPPQEPVEQITYEYLKSSNWTDHVQSFEKLFQIMEVKSFLEFGVGKGTKYFLDNCKQVTSVELVIHDRIVDIVPWYKSCLELFEKYDNWSPSIHSFSDLVNQANRIALKGDDPRVKYPDYIIEIENFCSSFFKDQSYDVAFVDPGLHTRGDFINALFGHADIIVAHDTNFHSTIYGWNRIQDHPEYEKISSPFGESGTTFWIKKTRSDIIEKLKKLLSQ